MDIIDLRTVGAIADAGSVTAAAARLGCVPSAVTARLRAIETKLGQPLFVRLPRGMATTSAGEVLRGYAERAVALMDEAERAIDIGAEPRGVLRVGATDTSATIHLPPVFASYHDAHPDVSLQVTSLVTDELIREVLRGRLDCAIVNTAPSDPGLARDHVRTERLVLATARAYVDPFGRSPATFLAARAGGAQRARIEAWWREAGGPPMSVIELPSIGLRLSFAAAGIGVTALPLSALDVLGVSANLRLHPIPEPWCDQEITLVSRVGEARFPAFAAFRDMLLRAYGGGG
jgi:DNA-binding transcriptional LysR family regulator